MKKVLKSRIFAFVLGALIFGGIVGVSAYTIFANDIGYIPKDTTWKKSNGEDITNVKDAIDELYTKANSNSVVNEKYDLIWENKNIHTGFEPTTISIDLSNYTSVIVMGKYHLSEIYDNNISFKKIDVGSSEVLTINYSQGDSATRNVIVKTNEIVFNEGHMWNNDVSASVAIPMYIVGIK